MPKISVIISVYNGAKFLSHSIESVINQDFTDWELLIIDDGSTDNTKEIVDGYVKKDKRLKYFYEENSGGPAKPKNLGFSKSSGSYIAYLDQDDEWLPTKLSKQINLFENTTNSKLGLVTSDVILVNESEKRLKQYKSPFNLNLNDLLIYDYIFSNSSVMLKREVIETIGPRDETPDMGYYEDWDMWLRIKSSGYDFDVVREFLINYTVRNQSLSQKASYVQKARYNEYFFNKHADLYKKSNLSYKIFCRLGLAYALAGDKNKANYYYKLSLIEKKNYLIPYLGKLLIFCGPSINNLAWRLYRHFLKG